MFRPQTVIIRPYNNLRQLVLYTYWDPIVFTLKCIKISGRSEYSFDILCILMKTQWDPNKYTALIDSSCYKA
jgi:hypothetical protein